MRLRQPVGEAAATCILLPEEQEATDDVGSAKLRAVLCECLLVFYLLYHICLVVQRGGSFVAAPTHPLSYLAAATHSSTAGEGALTGSSLTEVEELIKQLCGLTLPNGQGRRQEHQQHSDSLMRHVQVDPFVQVVTGGWYQTALTNPLDIPTVLHVPGVLFTPRAAHPAAVHPVREDGAAVCSHCGH